MKNLIKKANILLVKTVQKLTLITGYSMIIVAIFSLYVIAENIVIEDSSWVVTLAENREVYIFLTILVVSMFIALFSALANDWARVTVKKLS